MLEQQPASSTIQLTTCCWEHEEQHISLYVLGRISLVFLTCEQMLNHPETTELILELTDKILKCKDFDFVYIYIYICYEVYI